MCVVGRSSDYKLLKGFLVTGVRSQIQYRFLIVHADSHLEIFRKTPRFASHHQPLGFDTFLIMKGQAFTWHILYDQANITIESIETDHLPPAPC